MEEEVTKMIAVAERWVELGDHERASHCFEQAGELEGAAIEAWKAREVDRCADLMGRLGGPLAAARVYLAAGEVDRAAAVAAPVVAGQLLERAAGHPARHATGAKPRTAEPEAS